MGEVATIGSVAVKLPAYVEDGQTIRLKGQGGQGPGQPGDALVQIRYRPHPRYRVEGRDLGRDRSGNAPPGRGETMSSVAATTLPFEEMVSVDMGLVFSTMLSTRPLAFTNTMSSDRCVFFIHMEIGCGCG